jgi:hypothetical protein
MLVSTTQCDNGKIFQIIMRGFVDSMTMMKPVFCRSQHHRPKIRLWEPPVDDESAVSRQVVAVALLLTVCRYSITWYRRQGLFPTFSQFTYLPYAYAYIPWCLMFFTYVHMYCTPPMNTESRSPARSCPLALVVGSV